MQEFMIEEAYDGKSVMCESAGDYTLPDYMPEVRRLLRVDADAHIAGRYENGDKIEAGGDTCYTLLYTNDEGHLAATELDGTFEGTVNIPAGSPAMIYPRVETVSCRLSGPRKLSLRAGLELQPHAYRRIAVAPPVVDEVVGDVEMLCRPVHISATEFFHADDLALTESVKCDPGSTPLTTDAKVLVREVKCGEGDVRVRGEVWVTSLANNATGDPYTLSCKIPFEETIACDGVTPGFTGVARSYCRRVSCEIKEGTNGWNALYDVTLVLDGIVAENSLGEAVADLYAMSYEMDPKITSMKSRYYTVMQMANFTVDGSVSRETLGTGDESLRPVDARAAVATANCTVDGSVVVVEGELRVSCILACDATDGSYRSESFNLPYKVRVNCGEIIPYGTEIMCDAACIACRARAEGARLSLDAELGLMLLGTCTEETNIILSAEPNADKPIARAEDEIIAAYLSDGDSLWSIGKRYHVPLTDIARANSLPDEAMAEADFAQHLDGLSRLMIL